VGLIVHDEKPFIILQSHILARHKVRIPFA
jgi:hypothetical protein